MVVWKLENIPLYEVSVSRKRPRKEARLQVTLEGGYNYNVRQFQSPIPLLTGLNVEQLR